MSRVLTVGLLAGKDYEVENYSDIGWEYYRCILTRDKNTFQERGEMDKGQEKRMIQKKDQKCDIMNEIAKWWFDEDDSKFVDVLMIPGLVLAVFIVSS